MDNYLLSSDQSPICILCHKINVLCQINTYKSSRKTSLMIFLTYNLKKDTRYLKKMVHVSYRLDDVLYFTYLIQFSYLYNV